MRQTLEENDVAAVIIEPGGGYSDTIPNDPEYLAELPRLAREYGAIVIFDEVVTGFRYAVGGVQEYFGVTPDITTLGKVLGGGIPSGAIAGRAEVMSAFDEAKAGDHRPIPHHGTWNANPLAAVAGIATLELVGTGEPGRVATQRAEALRGGLNELFAEMGVPAVAYGRGSIWKTMPGERPRILDGDYSNYVTEAERMSSGWGELDTPLRQAMLLNGVDPIRGCGFMSCVHEPSDIDHTIEAFGLSLTRLREEGHLAH